MIAALDPDPAVPQRDLLLDRSHVAERLSVDDCSLIRVKYRIGVRLRVVHGIRAGSKRFIVASSTFPTPERSERAFEQARSRAVACAGLSPIAHDPELTTVFWTFPNDRKLEHLAALSGPALGLAELLPGWAASALASYAPEKAATVRCLDTAGRTLAFAKTYAGEECERACRVHEALTRAIPPDDPYLRLPRALAYSAAHRTVLVEAQDGIPIGAAAGAELRAGYTRLGRALARLHDVPPPDDARFRRLEPDRLEAAAELIASVRSDVGEVARSLGGELAQRLPANGSSVCLHGDVNFRNALLRNGHVALIDLDQVAGGPAAAELGSVLASIRYAGVTGLVPAAAVPGLCEAFVSGYSELRAVPDETALGAYTAAALLAERSLRVVTRIRPEGLQRLPALLAEAREALG